MYTPQKKKGDTLPRTETSRNQGRIFKGKEYLTVFSGMTGEALQSIEYIPQRGELKGWGRQPCQSQRPLPCMYRLPGRHTSQRSHVPRLLCPHRPRRFQLGRKNLKNHWTFDTDQPGNEHFAGQGNHNLRVADIDGDGCDEIVYGSMTVDHNGKGLYPQAWDTVTHCILHNSTPTIRNCNYGLVTKNKKDGSTFRDAATGKVIFQLPHSTDVGRCMAADIDPTQPGVEMWSARSEGIRNIKERL